MIFLQFLTICRYHTYIELGVNITQEADVEQAAAWVWINAYCGCKHIVTFFTIVYYDLYERNGCTTTCIGNRVFQIMCSKTCQQWRECVTYYPISTPGSASRSYFIRKVNHRVGYTNTYRQPDKDNIGLRRYRDRKANRRTRTTNRSVGIGWRYRYGGYYC